VFSVSQGSAEALIRWGGKCSIFWLHTLLVIFLPNIMKIRQSFRELQLKTLGMFFETPCRKRGNCDYITTWSARRHASTFPL